MLILQGVYNFHPSAERNQGGLPVHQLLNYHLWPLTRSPSDIFMTHVTLQKKNQFVFFLISAPHLIIPNLFTVLLAEFESNRSLRFISATITSYIGS